MKFTQAHQIRSGSAWLSLRPTQQHLHPLPGARICVDPLGVTPSASVALT